jgi:hypothetical protein
MLETTRTRSVPARLDSHRIDGQLVAQVTLKVDEAVLLRSRFGAYAREEDITLVGAKWRYNYRLAELEDVRHSHGSRLGGNFVDEMDAVTKCKLHRSVRTDRKRRIVVVHAVLRRGILLEAPRAVNLDDAALLRTHWLPPDMHVVESGLGRLGPLGVATTPDQHAATADHDGRVLLSVCRCEVRLPAIAGAGSCDARRGVTRGCASVPSVIFVIARRP